MSDLRPRPFRGTSAAAALAAVAAVVLLVAGCGGIPSSGPVHAGVELDGPPAVRVLAAPPAPGASALDIVRGFLRAQAGLDDDAAVARSYLVGSVAQSWAKRPQVVVYPDETSLDITAGSAGAYTVSSRIVATIDADGVYTQAPARTKAILKLKVLQVGGQWRIDQLDKDQVRWLTTYDLDRVYQQVALYYIATGTKLLVPDIRWFPETSGLATVVARAQLEPPPAYLRGAVTSGIPSSTTLAVDSVPTTGRVATVELGAAALDAGPSNRAMLWAQLAAAVAQVPGVDRVRVLVNNRPLELPGQTLATGTTAAALGFTAEPAVAADPVTLATVKGRSVVSPLVGNVQQTHARPTTLPLPTVRLRSVARTSDSREFAGVDRTGTALVQVVDQKGTATILTGKNLTRPSYDVWNWLWTASSAAGAPTRIYAALAGQNTTLKSATVTPAEPIARVSASWLVGRSVTSLRISRDGARALVTSTGPEGGSRVDVAGVTRGAQGRPVALSAPLRIAGDLPQVLDSSWVDATTVVLLARLASDSSPEPFLVTVGGAGSTQLPEVHEAVAIAAGSGATAIDIVNDKGQVLGPFGDTWAVLARGISVAFTG